MSPTNDLTLEIEPEREHQPWIDRLRQIDRLLELSVPSLIRVAQWSQTNRLSVPLWITERTASPNRKYILAQAICASTIQRLNGVQRRFSWLSKKRGEELAALARKMPDVLMRERGSDRTSLSFIQHAGSDLFGALNPLSSSEVFWAFIRAGERHAHSSVGFLMFFGILWTLDRRYPDKNEAGAALEPSRPTATTTAKCLVALHSLCEALRHRGEHYARASRLLGDIAKVSGKPGAHATWTFAFTLDLLAGTLFELSSYTIIPDDFVKTGDLLLAQTKELRSDSDTTAAWAVSRNAIRAVLRKLDTQQKKVFGDSRKVVEALLPKIVERLRPKGNHEELRRYCTKLSPVDGETAYWADHARAAEAASRLCLESLNALQRPFEEFSRIASPEVPAPDVLMKLMNALAESNRRVAEDIHRFVEEPVAWCRRIINEETARVSAGNLTQFDPAGLISAVTVAQKWRLISRPEAEDAIRHALQGALPDGSWMRGQPMFLEARALGMWPHTPDIVWMLAVAVNADPTITVADEKLVAFVDWLERTTTQIRSRDIGGEALYGWSSELDRVPNIIDLWNTNVSINALLEIRELIETRLWQICQSRFTIVRSRSLDDVAPVDLGAVHERRLHRRLMKIARSTRLPDKYKEEDYAIVLHGPPGSSKTAIVEGLGAEMWKGTTRRARIIRITPSDFTRQGEARLDYEARFIFELLSSVRGVTILFDEIDDFLRQRIGDDKPSFIQLITPAMLNRLQDLRDAAPRQELCFVIATNFIDKIEPALLRPGRIDSVIPVAYPDAWSRQAILEGNLRGTSGLSRSHMDLVLDETVGWPWSIYNKLTEEIAKKLAGVSRDKLREEIKRFGDRIQGSDHYYRDSKRWERYSPPLANEYVHLAFCKSKNLDACKTVVTELLSALPTKPPLEDMFERQAILEGRLHPAGRT